MNPWAKRFGWITGILIALAGLALWTATSPQWRALRVRQRIRQAAFIGPAYDPLWDAIRAREGRPSMLDKAQHFGLWALSGSEPQYQRILEPLDQDFTALKEAGYLVPHSFPWDAPRIPLATIQLRAVQNIPDLLYWWVPDATNCQITVYARPSTSNDWIHFFRELQASP